MARKHTFFLIAALVVLAGVAAYLLTGKPVEVGEITGKVIAVTSVNPETGAKADLQIALEDGRTVHIVVGRDPRPEVGDTLRLMEYRAEKRDIRSFEILAAE